MFSREQARAFYDRFGARQDSQGFYEDVATADLIAHGDFEDACMIYEFGCGTGRFADELLRHHLHLDSWYRGADISETMVRLTRERLQLFQDRARVEQSDGAMHIDAPDGSIDRVVSCYVLDLLSEFDILVFVGEAYRVLAADGLLCLVSLTHGKTVFSRILTAFWKIIHRVRPSLVGGCRPIALLEYLPAADWEIVHHNVVSAYGVSSEIVVARPESEPAGNEARGAL